MNPYEPTVSGTVETRRAGTQRIVVYAAGMGGMAIAGTFLGLFAPLIVGLILKPFAPDVAERYLSGNPTDGDIVWQSITGLLIGAAIGYRFPRAGLLMWTLLLAIFSVVIVTVPILVKSWQSLLLTGPLATAILLTTTYAIRALFRTKPAEANPSDYSKDEEYEGGV